MELEEWETTTGSMELEPRSCHGTLDHRQRLVETKRRELMREPTENPDWLEVWRRRAKDSCDAFRLGSLSATDAMTLALAVLCLPRADLPPVASRLADLLPVGNASLDPDACEAIYAVSQLEAFDRAVALFDLVRSLDRAWPSQ
jgi:hypothetical protein